MLHEWFNGRVEVSVSGCAEWSGRVDKHGYGVVKKAGCYSAHRLSWTMSNGEIPDGLCVLHRCDNRKCVNPDHLFLGTKKDNARDMVSKRRNFVPRGSLSGMAVLDERIAYIAKAMIALDAPVAHVARMCGVSYAVIYAIKQNRSWRHVKIV